MSARQERIPQGGSTNRGQACELPTLPPVCEPALTVVTKPASASTRQLSSRSRQRSRGRADGRQFASIKNRFTPEERARQRAMMTEIRDRMVVRNVDMRGSFREIDADRSGAVDEHEFAAVLRKAHMELPDADAKLLFAYGDTDGSGRLSYDEFCKAIERTGHWGSRYFGLEGAESDQAVKSVVAKWAKAEFAQTMGARINKGSAGRVAYYHMLDRDADGYVSKEDFIDGARKLNMAVKGLEEDVGQMFSDLAELQGGEGRLNFPLFGDLLTPLPDLRGTGPFGGDYRKKEIEALRKRQTGLEVQISENPAFHKWAAEGKTYLRSWKFEPTEENAGVAAGNAKPSRNAIASGDAGSADSETGAAGHSGTPSRSLSSTLSAPDLGDVRDRMARTLENGSYIVRVGHQATAPLGRTMLMRSKRFMPRRLVPAFNRGTHVNLVQPVPESAMYASEAERLVRAEHFSDKWDSGMDKREKVRVLMERTARRVHNEERVADMIKERQDNAELTLLCRSHSLGSQSLWLMERTLGQM